MEKKENKRCPECGFKIGSKDHKNGEHHKNGKNGKYKPNK